MSRRNFLKTTGAALAGTAFAASVNISQPAAAAEAVSIPGDRRGEAKLRIGSQFRGWIPGENDAAKMAQMKKWGMDAVECGGNVIGKEKEFKKMADDAGLAVAIICGGASCDKLYSPDPEVQRQGMDMAKRSLEAAAVLECNGIIFVPSFNHHWPYKNMTATEMRRGLIDIDANSREVKGGFLKELGDFAATLNTNIILEPLNRKEAWFLRQVGDAAVICRDCQSGGVKTMGDLYHMFYEENSNLGAFISGGEFVAHVHLGSGNRRVLPGQAPEQPREDFVDACRGLKYIGYSGFMCFECGCLGGDAKGETEVPKTLDFLRGCWEEA